MMQALWTAASGISSQQRKIDIISNNVANVDTVGYKTQDASFQDLLYRQFDQKQTPPMNGSVLAAQQRTGPVGLPLGSGVRLTGLESNFDEGSLQATGLPLDLAIGGNSFFGVLTKGNTNGPTPDAFTRNGHFHVGLDASGTPWLMSDQGYKVADSNGQPIDLTGCDSATIQVKEDGTVSAVQNGERKDIAQVGMFYFDHPEANLKPAGNNVFAYSAQAGAATPMTQLYAVTPQDKQNLGQIHQGFLEQSNVDMTTQMTDLIQSQRALDLSSKAVTTVDQMMGIANNLRN